MNRIKREEHPVNPNGLTFPVNRMKFGGMRGLQGQSVVLPFFTILANWPKAGTRAIFQARVDVVVFFFER
jgi:hypothetical protein